MFPDSFKNKKIFCKKIYGKEDLKRSDYQNGPITEMWNTLKICSSLKSLTVWGVRLKEEATSLSFAYLLRRNQHYKQYAYHLYLSKNRCSTHLIFLGSFYLYLEIYNAKEDARQTHFTPHKIQM